MKKDSFEIRKTSCNSCGSRDNVSVYSDGHTYCHGISCGKFTQATDLIDTPVVFKTLKKSHMIETGTFKRIESRNIDKEVCEAFNYQIGVFTGYLTNAETKEKELVTDTPVHICNNYNSLGELVYQKIRASNKRFTILGDSTKAKTTLVGAYKFQPSKGVFITIVEGEIDMLSVAQAQGIKYPVVSVPLGANSTIDAIKANLDYLQGFKFVVLALDNDKAGLEAVKAVVDADLFEPGMLKVAKWSAKDPNDLLKEGKTKEIVDALWQAKEIRPDNLVTMDDIRDKILKETPQGIDWPWKSLTDMTYGMTPSKLITIAAGSGIGKSSFVMDILIHMIYQEKMKCAIFSFEQQADDTAKRVISGVLNKNIFTPGQPIDETEVDRVIKDMSGYLWMQENYGGIKLEQLIPKLRYLVKAHGTKLIIIDHLTALAAKIERDERIGIDKVMDTLASVSRELDVCIILVVHLSRDKGQLGVNGKDWGEGRVPQLNNLRGSGNIEHLSDYVLGLSRLADSEDPVQRKILNVKCLKGGRYSNDPRGHSFQLMWNSETGRLTEGNIL